MKAMQIGSALIIGAMLLTGCSTHTTAPAPSHNDLNLSLPEAQAKAPFQLMTTDGLLPYGLVFINASATTNPNDGKVNAVELHYETSDKKALNVIERQGTTLQSPDSKILTETINGYEAQYSHTNGVSSIIFTNGKVVCYAYAPSDAPFSREPSMVELAKKFK